MNLCHVKKHYTSRDTFIFRNRKLGPSLCLSISMYATSPTWGHVPNPQGYNRHSLTPPFASPIYYMSSLFRRRSQTQTKLTNQQDMGMSSLIVLLLQVVMILLGQEIGKVSSTQYKVGGLDSWGIPIDANVYSKWPKSHSFKIGDSLLFLYPPSEDSLIQVAPSSFKSCNTKDPILYMNDGNSLFNLTQNGTFYFTSGHPGHCLKHQKLLVSVGTFSAEADALSPSSSADADAPSYQNAFGSIPLSQKSSSSSSLISAFSIFVASLACAVGSVGAIM